MARHEFFAAKVRFSDKRYAHFDVASKVAAIEIEGLDTGLRFDDLKSIFESQKEFSPRSAVARRLNETLDYLNRAFPAKSPALRNRSLVQSIATLAAQIVGSGKSDGSETKFYAFVEQFLKEYSQQVELGLEATDADYLQFQRTVNANVRGAAKIRHGIMLRKLLRADPAFAKLLDPATVTQSGLSADIQRLGNSIAELIEKVNTKFSASAGTDLIKPTNKTAGALRRIAVPIQNYDGYKGLISDLYFLFREGVGDRLKDSMPPSFIDINLLRTDLQHDVDHGKGREVAAKRRKISAAFGKYIDGTTPITLDPEHFAVFHARVLGALELDLKALLAGR